MSSRQVIKSKTQLDRNAYKLVVDLYGGDYSGNIVDESHPGLRYATEVCRVLGPQYSYAYIGIPVNEFGAEWAPAVALQQDGPAGKVKLRSRARVNMIDFNGNSIPLLVGSLTQYAHNLDEDSCVGMVMDDRWLLSKVTVFGAAIYDPVEKSSWFDAARPCIFNMGGLPDCLDAPGGPKFAPGRMFGYKPSQAVEDSNEPTQAKDRSRSWTCHDVVEYLRNMYYNAHRPSHPQNYGKQQLSLFIDWPSSFGSQYGFNRVVRNFSCENMDVATALGNTCRKAGPYEIQCNPVGWRGQLGLVQVNTRYGGTTLTGPTYGSKDPGGDIATAIGNATTISGGTVMESIVGFFDDVCICGDPPALEHQFSMRDETGPTVNLELWAGWSDDEEANFKKIIDDNGKNEAAFLMACKAEPRVYCTYKVKPAYDSYMKTFWPGFTPPCSPRILPFLLSGYAQNNTNPRDWNPREIILEYYDNSYGGTGWKACASFDNLTIIDEGNCFMVSSLRESGTRVTFMGSFSDTSSMVANKMRLTCAVEREFRITGKANADPNNTNSRVNRVGQRFTFLTVAEDGDYVHWERYQSRPNGNEIAEPQLSQDFPDKNSNPGGDWLFSDLYDRHGSNGPRIERHADHRLEDVKRIDYHGTLTMHTWNPSLRPGMQVFVNTGGNSIIPTAVIRAVTFNSQTQSQQVELMAADNATIYDVPLPSSGQTAGGSPSTSGGTTPKTAPATGDNDYLEDKKDYEYKTDQSSSQGSTSTTSSSGSDDTSTGVPGKPKPPEESQEQKDKRATKDFLWQVGQNARNAEWDKKDKMEEQRVKSSIRTGDQMSKGKEEADYTPAKAQEKRDAKEAGLVAKALRTSTRKDVEAYEEE